MVESHKHTRMHARMHARMNTHTHTHIYTDAGTVPLGCTTRPEGETTSKESSRYWFCEARDQRGSGTSSMSDFSSIGVAQASRVCYNNPTYCRSSVGYSSPNHPPLCRSLAVPPSNSTPDVAPTLPPSLSPLLLPGNWHTSRDRRQPSTPGADSPSLGSHGGLDTLV